MVLSILPFAALAKETQIEPFSVTVTTEADLRAAVQAGRSPIVIDNTINITGSAITIPNGANITIQGTGTLTVSADHRHFIVGTASASATSATLTLAGSLTLTRANGYTERGGGVQANRSGVFNMTGGAIRGNWTATGGFPAGGGVNIVNGMFHMSGGEISGNTGVNAGGGVYLGLDATFYMSGGRITGNTLAANWPSAGVHVSGTSTFTMRGGEISNNYGAWSGGGVSVRGSATFVMHGGTISGNRAGGAGGGGGVVAAGNDATFEMRGGVISGNHGPNGGGVNSYANGVVTMYAGSIYGNTATNGGGVGVGSTGATFVMYGGEIRDNTATALGGGVRVQDSVRNQHIFRMYGGEIHGNTARNGGGIYLGQLSPATIANGEIRDNTATTSGGGIFVANYSDLATGNTVRFSGNSAAVRHNFGAINRGADITVTDGGSGNPQNIDWAIVSLPDTHALNNYDINFVPRTPAQHTITFNLHGGTGNLPPQTVVSGGLATAPTVIPTRAGYGFIGWFTAPSGGVPFDFAAPITANTAIHAQWGAVNFVDSIHYMIGTERGTIEPHDPITRGGVATVLRRVMEHKTRVTFWTLENPFYDVPNNGVNWYSNAVSVVNASGLMTGLPDNLFGANQPLTRAQMAVLALRVADDLQFPLPPAGENRRFPDVHSGEWFYEGVHEALARGLVQGDAATGHFRPEDYITRAEFALLMNRLIGRTINDIYTADMIEWEDNPYGTWHYWALQIASNPTHGTPSKNWVALQLPYATPDCLFQP